MTRAFVNLWRCQIYLWIDDVTSTLSDTLHNISNNSWRIFSFNSRDFLNFIYKNFHFTLKKNFTKIYRALRRIYTFDYVYPAFCCCKQATSCYHFLWALNQKIYLKLNFALLTFFRSLQEWNYLSDNNFMSRSVVGATE